jgi:hypothetical protein
LHERRTKGDKMLGLFISLLILMLLSHCIMIVFLMEMVKYDIRIVLVVSVIEIIWIYVSCFASYNLIKL